MLPSRILKSLIEESNISYVDLEKKTGISKSALQRYASGTTKKIPINVVESLAAALDVLPSFIMGWDESRNTKKESTPREELIQEINAMLDKVPDDKLAKVRVALLSTIDVTS